jgi:peptidoglycan/xylan/chitin deacetylase (PgdA/CDA1 family)
LIESLIEARVGTLTLSFDDGYADSAEYIARRASRFGANAEWFFFVCPRKVATREGFAWDAEESGLPLKDLGDRPEFRLATVEECLELARLPNVQLGNHTSAHDKLTTLSPNAAAEEIRRSFTEFEAVFGRARHFAFPFGTPGLEFDARHVEAVRRHAVETIWSTEPRPYVSEERTPAAVLPRLAIDGRLTHRELLGWIAARATLFRARGPRSLAA